ncbi:MAG: DUF11 domain-containing protein [Planctomycetes bacterium]|nr:DUF11 domain-containing protein [Planctomycetota bacterium]
MNARRWLTLISVWVSFLSSERQAAALPYCPCPCAFSMLAEALPALPELAPECPEVDVLPLLLPKPLPPAPPCPPACPVVAPLPVTLPCLDDPPAPVVKLKVRVPACAPQGKVLLYRILVENCSPGAAHHVIVRNPLPANAKFVHANPAPTQATAKELSWKLGTMHGGEVRVIELALAPTSSDDVHNCTRVQFEYGQCVTTRQAKAPGDFPPDFVPPDKLPPDKLPPDKLPPDKLPPDKKPKDKGEVGKLIMSMSGPKQHAINVAAHYFITVANAGKAAATNVIISSAIPEGMKFMRADQGGKLVDKQIAWLLGTLEPGAARTVEMFLQASAAGEVCLKARALADKGLSAEADFCTIFGGASALGLEMIDRKDPVKLGDDTSYSIVVINQGKVPITNLRIKVLLPEGLVLVRATGPSDPQKDLGAKTPDGYPLEFAPLANLAPGASVEYEVFVAAAQVGDMRFKVEMSADQLPSGPVFETESTHVYSEEGAGGVQPPLLQTRLRRKTVR